MAHPAGAAGSRWYLIEMPSPSHPIQAVLQVTDVASYLVVSDTKTLVWANDLATGGPVSGARVRSAGSELGRTGADGVMTAPTPDALSTGDDPSCATDCTDVITVSTDEGRAAFLPTTGSPDQDSPYRDYGEAGDHWLVFNTDRTAYRSSDTVNAWGLIRTGKRETCLPRSRCRSSRSPMTAHRTRRSPAVDVTPRPDGVFTGSVRIRDLPLGWYRLDLRPGRHRYGAGI